MIRISEFQMKDVVNVSNGKKLGHVEDIVIDYSTGNIKAIVMRGAGGGFRLFSKENEIVVPWENILKIGEDVILVRHKNLELSSYSEQ